MLITIIVPIYNAARFLDNCLSSIARQTYTEFEVILVNDGSNDRSYEICKLFAENNSRFSIINKKNEGVSKARNDGIAIANGEWITFIDADDKIDSDYLNDLAKCVNNSVDFIIQGVRRLRHDGELLSQTNLLDEIVSSKSYYEIFKNHKLTINSTPHSKLFKKQIIEEFNLGFVSDIGYNEDLIFILEYLFHCKGNIVFSSTINYNYYINPKSITNTLLQPEEYWKPYLYFKKLITNNFCIDYFDNDYRIILENFKIQLHMFINAVFVHNRGNENKYINLLAKEDWLIYRSISHTSTWGRKVFDFFLLNKWLEVCRLIVDFTLAKHYIR